MNRKNYRFVILLLSLLFSFNRITALFAQTITEIVEQVGKSVVMIVAYDITGSPIGQGSGVFIAEDGQILTNAHVLEDAYSAEVVSTVGIFKRVRILYKDDKRDLAIIEVATDQATPADFAFNDTDFKAGQRVIAIGNPLGLEKTVSDGLISGIRQTEDGVELIQTTVPISPGSSGGVLLNESGQVIGITASTLCGGQNINFAISLNTIVAFAKDYMKDDPQKIKFQELKLAKESVWYRVILKRVGYILLLLVGLVFGGGFFYIILFVGIAGYIVYGIVRGVWWLVSHPFRKVKGKKEAEAYEAYLATLPAQSAPGQSSGFNVEPQSENGGIRDDEETDLDSDFVFYCSKCGHRYSFPKNLRIKSIECVSCHKQITIPTE